jgi:uncharacterized membrane-anchored protein
MMTCVPKINRAYWTCLILASIFGANAGDFVADVLRLGHLSGIPYLAASLAAVFVIEWISPQPTALYFWIVIIIIRASATNIGDVFHDLKIGFAYSVPLMTVALISAVAIWRAVKPSDASRDTIPVNAFYWVTMFVAGVLGTVGGDAMSYGVRLGNMGATIALGVPLALTLWIGRKGMLTQLYYYWFTVGLIRSAGTSAGDWLAHGPLGLTWATVVSGVVFFALVLLTYTVESDNTRLGSIRTCARRWPPI